MKLESITVENYRQFEKAELTFDEGITILAGANNSGKTSLINLIKNIFVDDKLNYNMSDIPAKNMREWVEWVYPIFQKFFRDRKTEENVEKDLLNVVIPKEETDSTHLMKMTTVKIHVSYNPDMDDIKLFADCIMDLDETKHDFYFMYNFEIVHTQFAREIINNFSKIKHRFAEIEEKKSQYAETTDELIINNIQVKERYLKQLIVSLYIQATIPNVYFCDEDYKNKCKFDETKKFRQLFNFCFIKASRPLDDDESDHSHMLSKQMIKMVKMDEKWNELVESLPDEVLKPIQEKEIDKAIRSTSLESLKDTIATLEQTNGGKSGELMLDMQISEEDISDLLQRITTATYDIDGYYLGESSQGLGYSNMIYIHLQLKEYEKNIDPLKVNMFFLSETYQCEMDEHCTENVINMMTNEFPTSAAKKTYAQCVFLKKEQDDYGISDSYEKMLQNPEFCAILEELVDFGISRYKVNYSYHYQDTNLVLYQKYTYEDACRLLNWERNEVPLNIGGYKYDKKTKTFPIFINYDKQDNISDTTKYEDHFVAENRLIAISKSGRSMDSEDVRNFLKATERGIDVQLFVRKNKDDKISKEFYYLGRVIATGNAKQFVMPNTDKTAVKIEWELETPVREDIYQYIVNE